MSRVIHLNEIIPNRLYQRGQFVTFPWKTKMEMLERYDIGMVVNLWSRPDPELHTKNGLIYIHWPIAGNKPPEPEEPMVHMLDHYLGLGIKMLVHCEAGVNRSIWLAAKLYAKQYRMPGVDALHLVREGISRTKMRDGLVKDLINSDYS